MDQNEAPTRQVEKPERQPYRIRLPGLIGDQDVGLGDAIKRTLQALNIAKARPCGRCDKRAAALNRWIVFTR